MNLTTQALEDHPSTSARPEDEFILAQLNACIWVIPSVYVAEILMVEKSQVLPLPFYASTVLGCIHHDGAIVPLVAGDRLLGIESDAPQSNLAILRLSEAVEGASGVGLTVNRMLGNKLREQLPQEIFERTRQTETLNPSQTMTLFDPKILDSLLWHPLSWQASS